MTFEEFWYDHPENLDGDLVGNLVTWQQMGYIERLAMMSTMTADEVFATLDKAQHMTIEEANTLIKILELSQKNPEEYGITNQTTNVESVKARMARDDFYEK